MKSFIPPMRLLVLVLVGCAFRVSVAETEPRPKAEAAPQPAQVDKAQVEVDFWRSVERLDTADAYVAYLEVYPQGRFAPLARIAIKKLGRNASVGVSPAQATSSAGLAESDRLKPFREDASSGAIGLQVGDRIRGPGVVTVGRIGARKQLAIPAGEWVVIAATDHNSEAQSGRSRVSSKTEVRLTTLTLAQFEGTTARSLLTATFNRLVSGNPAHVWRASELCGKASPDKYAYHATQGDFTLKLCAYLRYDAQTGTPPVLVAAHDQEVRANLSKLGGTLGSFNSESVYYVVDRQASYLNVVKLDCTQAGATRPDCAGASVSPGNLEQQKTWTKDYGQQVFLGFERKLSLPVLNALNDEEQKP